VELERYFRIALCDKELNAMAAFVPPSRCTCIVLPSHCIVLPHVLHCTAGVELERHFRTALCDKEPSVMAATLNALQVLAATNPAPFR
jgi:hypothetical protein